MSASSIAPASHPTFASEGFFLLVGKMVRFVVASFEMEETLTTVSLAVRILMGGGTRVGVGHSD